ncbi:MAG: type II toxin-antitoxin system RelE/ParE family toxin [Planctomycetes bacterium]|nr:type II toxin-antitoxin system RelE/ParE family toxin [Planctomycetota bacterium]
MLSRIALYQEADGICPVVEFLRLSPERVRAQARERLRLLAERGHPLRRPHADYLEDGLFELRWRTGRVRHRILYFVDGPAAVALAHAVSKGGAVPAAEIDRAKRRRANFRAGPATHTFTSLGGLSDA